jgi:hypothetical protein
MTPVPSDAGRSNAHGAGLHLELVRQAAGRVMGTRISVLLHIEGRLGDWRSTTSRADTPVPMRPRLTRDHDCAELCELAPLSTLVTAQLHALTVGSPC